MVVVARKHQQVSQPVPELFRAAPGLVHVTARIGQVASVTVSSSSLEPVWGTHLGSVHTESRADLQRLSSAAG